MDPNIAELIRKILIFMPTFLLALVVHEYGHARMAKFFGDTTSEWSGRLTLNPIPHIDPMGTIVFPLFSLLLGANIFFGWAKPVPIDVRRFSNYRKGLFWVSFAGPLANIILGFISAFLYVAMHAYIARDFAFFEPIAYMLQTLIMINFSLAVFNLIPMPPLDGSNIVLSFLSYEATRKFMEFQQYSFYIMLALMFSGAFSILKYPIVLLYSISMNLAISVFGFASVI